MVTRKTCSPRKPCKTIIKSTVVVILIGKFVIVSLFQSEIDTSDRETPYYDIRLNELNLFVSLTETISRQSKCGKNLPSK
jgi:hypothetical protein